jgi:hypothetical protein
MVPLILIVLTCADSNVLQVRDMDAFIHLIRLRDGVESLAEDVQVLK